MGANGSLDTRRLKTYENPMKDVFISYDSSDHIHAQSLHAALQFYGFSCWIDDGQIHGGHSLLDRIRQGIRDSKFLCAVVTPRYSKSYYARIETELMRRREGILAPVRTIPCLFENNLPGFFGEVAYVDFRGNFPEAARKLVASLRHHAAEHVKRASIAKWTAGGVAVVAAAIAFVGDSNSDKRQEQFITLLFMINHVHLGAILKDGGYPVPSKKEDRVAAIMEHYGVSGPLIGRLLSAKDLQNICRAAGQPTAGTKEQLIEAILSV